jgi:hypothetical protein
MFILKVIQTEFGLAVMFADEAAKALRVGDGDVLRAEVDETGGLRLFGCDPRVVDEVALGEVFLEDYRGTLRALAK